MRSVAAAVALGLIAAVLAVQAAGDASAPSASPRILETAADGIVLGGLALDQARSAEALRLYPEGADWTDPTFPAVAGTVVAAAEGVRFVPRHPLVPGGAYRIVWRAPGEELPWVGELEVPRVGNREAPRVTAVYPSGDVLPENQLKLYLHFSAPMDRRAPYEYLRLIDADTGEEMAAVFHALRSGLWDPSGTRLTIVFDPGRIKRGLANHEAWGPPLVQGRGYRLVVDAGWPDSRGVALARSFEKAFRVGPPDREKPDPERWRVSVPPAGSLEPAVVRFDEPLDRAVLQGGLDVRGPRQAVRGRRTVSEGETEWRFAPDEPWRTGEYAVVIGCHVEDLAGNNLSRLFDVDLTLARPPSPNPPTCPVHVPFTIQARPAGSAPTEDTRP